MALLYSNFDPTGRVSLSVDKARLALGSIWTVVEIGQLNLPSFNQLHRGQGTGTLVSIYHDPCPYAGVPVCITIEMELHGSGHFDP